jgi:hypothetical protein
MDSELDSQLKSIRTLPLNKLKAAYLAKIPEDLVPCRWEIQVHWQMPQKEK